MHKNGLRFILLIVCIYFSLVFCAEVNSVQKTQLKDSNDLFRSDTRALIEDSRMRRKHHHHLYSFWGFYSLAAAYLIKIKVVVVAFFVGSAIYLGLRYMWPHKCSDREIYKEGSVVLDQPPPFAHYNHIPYSLDHDHYDDHHYDSGSFTSSGSTSFEPYSAYTGHSYTEPESSLSGSSPDSYTADAPNFRRKRSKDESVEPAKNLPRKMAIKEEQIGDFVLNFLGLDTNACRRRFICEIDFKSRTNPLTSMAFRVIGHSFFAKYSNKHNNSRAASSFEECAAVNAECVFIENNDETDDEATTDIAEQTNPSTMFEKEAEIDNIKNSAEINDSPEWENENNLKAELRSRLHRHRFGGSHH